MKIASLLCAVLVLLLGSALGVAAQTPNLASGQLVFNGSCASCHAGGPSNTRPFPLAAGSLSNLRQSHGDRGDANTNLAFFLASKDTSSHTFSGIVTNANGQGVAGVLIRLTGNYQDDKTTITAANGGYTFSGLSAGDYLVEAPYGFLPARHTVALTIPWKAVDGGNRMSALNSVNFKAGPPPVLPTVALSSPVAGNRFVAPATVPLTATADDRDGTVDEVAFYAAGQFVGRVFTPPFNFMWANVGAGTNSVVAVAKDNAGNFATSAPVVVAIIATTTLPGINIANGKLIYERHCMACHLSPPGAFRNSALEDERKKSSEILLAASRFLIRPGVASYIHSAVGATAPDVYINTRMSEPDQSDLAAYIATQDPYRFAMTGTVRDQSGQPIADALVTITSTYLPGASVTTDASGAFCIDGLYEGDYQVSATTPDVELMPPSYRVTYAERTLYINDSYRPPASHPAETADALDFRPNPTVNGTVRTSDGVGFPGIVINASTSGQSIGQVMTDINGHYTLVATNTFLTLTPEMLAGYTSDPVNLSLPASPDSQSNLDFTITAFPQLTLSGRVTDNAEQGVADVVLTITELPGVMVSTDAAGNYSIPIPRPGAFTITPTKDNTLFTPLDRMVIVGVGGATNINFLGVLNSFIVSGIVRTPDTFSGPPFFDTIPGQPIANAAVTAGGQAVRTGPTGLYLLTLTNGNYTIVVEAPPYSFEVPTRSVTVNGEAQFGLNFAGTLPVVHVRPGGSDFNDGISWLSAKATVQAALNVTGFGAEVWVGSGTYYERITVPEGVALYGGFAGYETTREQRDWRRNRTAFDGDPPPFAVPPGFTPGNVVRLVDGSRLDGFTITGGNATSPDRGGGVNCQGGTPIIANCYITGNSASTGGGIGCAFSSAIITNNIIAGNSARLSGGGIYADAGGRPTILNNLIRDNTSESGGGGVDLHDTYSPLIGNNTVVGNLVTNTSSGGGGIYLRSSFGGSALVNNLIAFNSSGIFCEGTSPNGLTNNLVFGNVGFNYSGLSAGIGDIDMDPAFADVASGDLRLLVKSPAINAGENLIIADGAVDLDGLPRIIGASVDVGAYEFSPMDLSPTVAIAATLNGASFETSSITIHGTAIDDTDVALVEVRVNEGVFQLATGTTEWSRHVNLSPGNNTIEARSRDSAGSYSPLASVTVIYIAPDILLPTVAITSPSDNQTLDSTTLIISGTATDNQSVILVEVRINGGDFQLATGTESWSQSVTLNMGVSDIEARSWDLAGNYSPIASLSVTVTPPDTQPPGVLIVANPNGTTVDNQNLMLMGTANDSGKGDNGIASVTVNGQRANNDTSTGSLFAQWNKSIILEPGLNSITLVATDGAGNQTTLVISVTYSEPDTTAPIIVITSPDSDQTVSSANLILRGTATDNVEVTLVEARLNDGSFEAVTGTTTWTHSLGLVIGSNTIEVRGQDAAGNLSMIASLTVIFILPDTQSPGILIVANPNGTTVDNQNLMLMGTANDSGKGDNGIASVTVNGQRANNDTSTGSLFAQWNKSIILEPGLNSITLVATDGAGNQTTLVISVTYSEPNSSDPPKFGLTTINNGAIQLSLTGPALKQFVIEATADIFGGWTGITTNQFSESGTFTLSDPVQDHMRRFYRVILTKP